MMLQIEHRESHDIDLFLDDPQLLGYVSAAVEELEFDIGIPNYNGDGTGHIKIAFEGIGEIDFIVTRHMTDNHAVQTNILNHVVELETIAEIVTKKVRFRGANLQARDIFDIAAACYAGYSDDIENALSAIPKYRIIAAQKLEELKPDYVNSVISQLMLKPDFKDMSQHSISIAKQVLNPK